MTLEVVYRCAPYDVEPATACCFAALLLRRPLQTAPSVHRWNGAFGGVVGGMKKERSERANLALTTGKSPITLSAWWDARAGPGQGREAALSCHIACGERVQCVRQRRIGRLEASRVPALPVRGRLSQAAEERVPAVRKEETRRVLPSLA